MFFENIKDALNYAKLQTIYTKIKHKAVKCNKYCSYDIDKIINGYTVTLSIKKA